MSHQKHPCPAEKSSSSSNSRQTRDRELPKSTYRLQLSSKFTLVQATEILDYLAKLGVDCVYCSPLLKAVTGSNHGYDWVDASLVDPERGGEEGWAKFSTKARELGIKILVDIVPNHMGIAHPKLNPWWWDVLTFGQDSSFAHYFDIDWDGGPILVPVLANAADIARLEISSDKKCLTYYDRQFPIKPGTFTGVETPQEVHSKQSYRLADWREGQTSLNYRRFFAVTELAGLRVELDDVFLASHTRIFKFVADDNICGLRVDHPDGLADPGEYFSKLRAALGDEKWLLGEKILEPGEELPNWPIDGTTGYDAMREVDQLLVNPSAENDFNHIWVNATDDPQDFHQHVLAGKKMVAKQMFTAELNRILKCLSIPSQISGIENFQQKALTILVELAAMMPVYRTYLPAGRQLLTQTGDQLKTAQPELSETVDLLLPQLCCSSLEAARRFQQLTGAVMAKGVEDTAYYRYNRLTCLNEVGGDPGSFGYSVEKFHHLMENRQKNQPWSMTTLSTHDTKRSADVRAKMAVLSEIPEQYKHYLQVFFSQIDIPQPRFGVLMAQTLAAVGRIEKSRLHAYFEKAMREAADGTSWLSPNKTFEQKVHAGLERCFTDPVFGKVWDEILETIRQPGWSNCLVQKGIQLTMPGIPDVYQGSELWEDSLVDPDNRRWIDYQVREKLLTGLTKNPPIDETGRAKLWITTKILQLRQSNPEGFSSYRPLWGTGLEKDHLVGFDRGQILVFGTRLPHLLNQKGGWRETSVSLPYSATDVLTGTSYSGRVALADIFSSYPIACLLAD